MVKEEGGPDIELGRPDGTGIDGTHVKGRAAPRLMVLLTWSMVFCICGKRGDVTDVFAVTAYICVWCFNGRIMALISRSYILNRTAEMNGGAGQNNIVETI